MGVAGFIPGVPGFSRGPPSLCLSDGVDLEEEDRLEGGRSLSLLSAPLSPMGGPWFPFICRSPVPSSFPTSTTRSPSDLSPLSDSCPDFRRSFSILILLAAFSSFGVDALMPGDLMGDLCL